MTHISPLQVRSQPDRDGDGVSFDNSAIESDILAAEMNILSEHGREDGEDLCSLNAGNDEMVHDSSSVVGLLVRAAGRAPGPRVDRVTEALAADAADREIHGVVTPSRHQ